MDKMKRIFSFVLVFAILAGSFASFSTVAYADTAVATEGTEVLKKVPADVIGTEHEDAVRRLVAFGIIGGYPDGSYKPERVVNRAQFAKIIVEALGLRDAVPAAEGQATGFKDVAGDYWAAGYINVASGQGLIKGYPDGTFKPAREVTYAQALTMLVRALGYQDEFLKGTWPGNYVSKAADAGITTGVRIPSNAQEAAKRGYVAELVNNALDAKVVKVDTYKPNTGSVEYYETEIPLLKDKLEISKYEDTRIIADKIVDDGLDKDEVRVRFLEATDRYRNDRRYNRGEVVKKEFAKGAEETFRYYADVNPRELIGEEITTYIDDNDKVIYVEDERDDKANFDFVEKLDGKKLELVKFDKEYDFETKKDEEAIVWVYNNSKDRFEREDAEDIKREDLIGRMGKVVVKNNRIVYAEFQQASDVSSEWLLVRENKDGNLMGVSDQTEDFKLDLRKDKDYDYALVYNTKGEKMSLKDIKEGNIVYVDEIDYDGDDVALVTVVTDNKVEGEVGRVKTDRIEIDKKEIKVVKTKKDNEEKFHASYTTDSYDEVKKWEKESTWEDDMEDAYKENAVAYKDGAGRIAFLEIAGGDSGYKFGIVTRTYADGDRIRIFTTIDGKEGKDQIFKADKERDISTKTARMLDEWGVEPKNLDKATTIEGLDQTLLGSAVKFRLNSDGEIADGKFFVMPEGSILSMSDDFGKDVIKTKENKTYVVNSDSVVVIDAATAPIEPRATKLEGDIETLIDGVDVDEFDVTTWKDIKEDKEDSKLRFFVFPKTGKANEADGLVFVGKEGANTGSDEIAVYILDKWRAGDDIKVEYVTYGNNEKQVRVLDHDKDSLIDTSVSKERAYVAKEKSNGKLTVYEGEEVKNEIYKETDDFEIYRDVEVEKVSGNYIKVKGVDEEFYVSGSLIYDEDKSKASSFIKKGDKVDIVSEGIRARVIGVDPKEKTSTEDGETTDGVVTYINDERIFIGNDKYKMDADTILYDTDEKAIKAVGGKNINKELDEKSIVKDVKTKGDLVTEMTLVGSKDSVKNQEEEKLKDFVSKMVLPETGRTVAENIKIITSKLKEEGYKDIEVTPSTFEEEEEINKGFRVDVKAKKLDIDLEVERVMVNVSKEAQEELAEKEDKEAIEKAIKEIGEKVTVSNDNAEDIKNEVIRLIGEDNKVNVSSVEVLNASPKRAKVTLEKGKTEKTVEIEVEVEAEAE